MNVVSEDLIGNARRIHMVGIGGVGMSALARILKRQGYEVRGSDCADGRTTRLLRDEGIPVYERFNKNILSEADLVIYSSAILRDDRELVFARGKGISIYHRAQILASLLHQANTSIGITGTHGKTTTTSMVAFCLRELDQNPTCLVGGDIVNYDANAISGSRDLWVAEVDESDRSHECYGLNYAIVTNLEQDHIEKYRSLGDLRASFELFARNVSDPGLIVYSEDDSISCDMVRHNGKAGVKTGFSPQCDYSAEMIEMTPSGVEFDLLECGFFARRVRLSVPGRHNISNALSTIALLVSMGYDLEAVCETLSAFKGARRRLEIKGRFGGLTVVDDYAHHPTEIRASLDALQAIGEEVTVIFQPHRFSRTAHFFKDFAKALVSARHVIVTDIHPAGEVDPGNIHAGLICEELKRLRHDSVRQVPLENIVSFLAAQRDLRGIVAFLGAGNIGGVADEFANRLKNVAAA